MGHDWSHAVAHDKRAKLGDRLVLFVLAESADNETGTCYPSIKSIAERAGLSERAVHYSLKKLSQMNMISIQRNASPYGTNIYNLTPMKGGAKFAPGAKYDAKGVQWVAPEPSIEPSKENIYSPDFETFWSSYPRGHGNKKKSYDQWQHLTPAQRQRAIDQLPAWHKSQRWADGYIKLAELWLRDKYFDDDPPAEKPPKPHRRDPDLPSHASRMTDYDPEIYG